MTPELKAKIQKIKDAIKKDIESNVEVSYTPESVLEMIEQFERDLNSENI